MVVRIGYFIGAWLHEGVYCVQLKPREFFFLLRMKSGAWALSSFKRGTEGRISCALCGAIVIFPSLLRKRNWTFESLSQ